MAIEPASLGIILFAHGSRDPLWRKPIEAVRAKMLATQPRNAVVCAYLELCAPDLPTAALQLMSMGCTQIRIVPLLLGVGRHAREDLPALLDKLMQQYPQTRFELRPAIGEDARVTDLIADIALAADRELA